MEFLRRVTVNPDRDTCKMYREKPPDCTRILLQKYYCTIRACLFRGVYVCVCVCVCVWVCGVSCLSVCLPACLPVRPSVRPSACLPVCLSVCLITHSPTHSLVQVLTSNTMLWMKLILHLVCLSHRSEREPMPLSREEKNREKEGK